MLKLSLLLRYFLVFFSSFCLLGQTLAQQSDTTTTVKVDSLRAILDKTSDVEKKALIYDGIARVLIERGKYSEAIDSYKEALEWVDTEHFPELYVKISLRLGRMLYNPKVFKLDSAFHYIEQAYSLLEVSSPDLQVKIYVDMLEINYQLYKFEEAVEYCLKCIELAKKIDDKYNLRMCYSRMAAFNLEFLKDTAMIKTYGRLALDIALAERDTYGISIHYLHHATDFIDLGEYTKGLSYLDSCAYYGNIAGVEQIPFELLLWRGVAYHRMQKFEEAKKSYNKARIMADEAKIWNRMMHLRMYLAEVAILQQKYTDAVKYATEALSLAPDKLTLYELEGTHRHLSKAFKGLHNDKKALYHFEQWIIYKDSTIKVNNLATIAGLERKYKSKEQKKQIDFQQATIAQQQKERNLITIALVLFGILSAGLLLLFLRMRASREKVKQQHQLISAQSEELHKLNEVKSRFFANASHELRTPLTLILGPLSYLLDDANAWGKESVKQQLRLMQRNGKSLLHLIEEILDLAKIEAHQFELEEEETFIVPFMERITSPFTAVFEHKSITYNLLVKTSENLRVKLDRVKMEKVLNNLLSNAVKFTPEGGTINFCLTEMEDTLQFQVIDSGKGIHPKDLPYVFDRFYQAKHSEQTKKGGTGIGLSLVKEMAHLMKGRAYAVSTLGEGCRFYFEIPKKKKAIIETYIPVSQETWEALPIYSIGTDFTIMVVEDNLDLRTFIHQLLSAKYTRILLAENGEEGLALLKKHGKDIHLIVSDIMMPKMDGVQMIKEIKSNKEWSAIPVVMLTALATELDKLNALSIGVDDYLFKPFSTSELLTRVQNLLYNYQERRIFVKSLEGQAEFDSFNLNLSNSTRQGWVKNLENLVSQSLTESLFTVEGLAAAVFISPRQLRRKLKLLTGLSPNKFIKEIQLKKARQELETGRVFSLADVAFNCGFEHQATFSTVFKSRYGVSPSKYLKSNKK